VLGWLFKNKTETEAKQELLIFLTPTIVKTI
jgi:type IV pilus assembly protein PilQ